MDINNEEQNEIEIDLRELFFHKKRYWYIVVVSILVGVLGAAFYIYGKLKCHNIKQQQ